MNTPPEPEGTERTTKAAEPANTPRDAAYWATPVNRLKIATLSGVEPINVRGRQVVGPLQGFGQMWQKTYRVRLGGCETTPAEAIATWKANFGSFWPKGNRFFAPLTSIEPGEVNLISVTLGGPLRLSTGVMVIYADEESFTFMTPEGHMFAAWITFSAYEDDGCTVAQVQALLRANDPLYELGMRLGVVGGKEDQFWTDTLQALAAHFGVHGLVQTEMSCIDPKMQWHHARNIWYNAAIRTTLYMITWPLRQLRRLVAGDTNEGERLHEG